jgi:shikimate dehydrogenase
MNLTGRAKLAGVMGWPVSHSRSPRLHNYWVAKYGIDGVYVPLAVAPENLREALQALAKLGFAGVNLTVPHKEAALSFVDEVDLRARTLGAINTIVVRDSSLIATNTDTEGFRASLLEAVPEWCGRSPAVVLGAGGASRAVCAALKDLGVSEIRLINRSDARAQALAEGLTPLGLSFDVLPWTARNDALDGAGLLVNTTVLGMNGQKPLDIRLECLPDDAVVSDIVYVPLETPLLKAASARGHRIVDGLGMLLHQARPGFAAWFGVMPDVTSELRAHVLGGI